jgi:hypothetical protein
MRLLYLNKIYTNAGWGAETFLNDALQNLGIETICVDYEANKFGLAHYLMGLDQDFDAFLLQRGRGYLIPATIIRALRRPRFFLFTELVARNRLQHYLLRDHLFDYVFLRSSACVRQVTQRGWLHPDQVGLMLSAIRPDFYRPMSEFDRDIEILFIGSITPRRREILTELSKEFDVTVRSTFGEEMVELVNRAKIVLNIHAEVPLDTETRVYEVLACKGFLITEKLSEESPFVDKTHLIESSSLTQMKQNIRYYLNHPELRDPIAEDGYQLVVRHHTVNDQAKQLVATIEQYLPATRAEVMPFDYSMLRKASVEEQTRKLMKPITNFLFRALDKSKRSVNSLLLGGKAANVF